MKTRTGMISLAGWSASSSLVLALALTPGCGGGKDDALVAPPPPSAPPVSMTATPEVAPPTGNPADGAPNVTAAAGPGAGVEAGPVDKFKNMTPQQIEDFKAQTTPETHDMNLAPLMEAVTGYMGEFRRAPTSQEEMVKARYLPRVLQAPKGKRYVINPETGEVTLQ